MNLADVYKRQMQELMVILELKLLADVGLVGFPNAGKSTLLSTVSVSYTHLFPFALKQRHRRGQPSHLTALYRAFSLTYPDAVFTFLVPILRILCPIGQIPVSYTHLNRTIIPADTANLNFQNTNLVECMYGHYNYLGNLCLLYTSRCV